METETIARAKPRRSVRTFKITAGEVEVTVKCYPGDPQFGWPEFSMKDFYTAEQAAEQPALRSWLGETLLRHGCQGNAFSPSVKYSSATVVRRRDLKEAIPLGNGTTLFRNESSPSDAVFMGCGDAVPMSLRGCPFLVATGDEHALVGHMSRDSSIDRARLFGAEPRTHESIVLAMISALEERGVATRNIRLWGFFGIEAEAFSHDLDYPMENIREYNRLMVRDVTQRWQPWVEPSRPLLTYTGRVAHLSLHALFRAQALSAGILRRNIHWEQPLPTNGLFGSTRHESELMRERSNMAIAVRTR